MLALFIFIFSSWSSANTEHSNGYWAGFFNDIGLRLRLLGRYQKPINDTHSFVIWNEYFHQFTTPTWVYNEDFDRNRYFLGLRSKWNNISFEYGYSNQYVNRRGADLSEHLFLFYLVM